MNNDKDTKWQITQQSNCGGGSALVDWDLPSLEVAIKHAKAHAGSNARVVEQQYGGPIVETGGQFYYIISRQY